MTQPAQTLCLLTQWWLLSHGLASTVPLEHLVFPVVLSLKAMLEVILSQFVLPSIMDSIETFHLHGQ